MALCWVGGPTTAAEAATTLKPRPWSPLGCTDKAIFPFNVYWRLC